MGVSIFVVISLVLFNWFGYHFTEGYVDCRRNCNAQKFYLSQFTYNQAYINNVHTVCMRQCSQVTSTRIPTWIPRFTTTTTPWWRRTTTTTPWWQRTTTTPWWQRKTTTTPWWQRKTTTTPWWQRKTTTTPWWLRTTTTAPPITVTQPVNPPQFGCGFKRQFSNRVIGGLPARECQFPWMIQVRSPDLSCGGTIIDERHVVTAAHCLKYRISNAVVPVAEVYIRAGSSRRSQLQTYKVSKLYVHPEHNLYRDYDIAVLTLEQDLVYNECIAPICLPTKGQRAEFLDECVVAGWGVTDVRPSLSVGPDLLQQVTVPIVDRAKCMASYGGLYFNDLKLCAGYYEQGQKDSCQGDSGGPLMCRNKNGPFTLFGVVSYGYKCALPRYPGVYTRVNHPLIMQYILQAKSDVTRTTNG